MTFKVIYPLQAVINAIFSYNSAAVETISDDTEHRTILPRQLFTSKSNGCVSTNRAGALTDSDKEILIVIYSFVGLRGYITMTLNDS